MAHKELYQLRSCRRHSVLKMHARLQEHRFQCLYLIGSFEILIYTPLGVPDTNAQLHEDRSLLPRFTATKSFCS